MSLRGHRWDRFRQLVFATYGGTCWICSHGGARTVDHVESVTEHPERAWDLSNCRPAHGTYNRCLTCGQCCNQLKGGYSVERARRIIAERQEKRREKPPERPAEDAGREF